MTSHSRVRFVAWLAKSRGELGAGGTDRSVSAQLGLYDLQSSSVVNVVVSLNGPLPAAVLAWTLALKSDAGERFVTVKVVFVVDSRAITLAPWVILRLYYSTRWVHAVTFLLTPWMSPLGTSGAAHERVACRASWVTLGATGASGATSDKFNRFWLTKSLPASNVRMTLLLTLAFPKVPPFNWEWAEMRKMWSVSGNKSVTVNDSPVISLQEISIPHRWVAHYHGSSTVEVLGWITGQLTTVNEAPSSTDCSIW